MLIALYLCYDLSHHRSLAEVDEVRFIFKEISFRVLGELDHCLKNEAKRFSKHAAVPCYQSIACIYLSSRAKWLENNNRGQLSTAFPAEGSKRAEYVLLKLRNLICAGGGQIQVDHSLD